MNHNTLASADIDAENIDQDNRALQMVIYRRPRLRLNYSTIFTAAVCAFMLLTWLYGAGCFDRFITH